MAIDKCDAADDRQARLDAMIDEFQKARQSRLLKQGLILWNRTERAQRNAAVALHIESPKKN
jgi:hypothetical protein